MLIAPNKVNIIDVKHCGEIIINKMEGTSPLTYSFKRIMQVVQMPTSSDILNKKDAKVSLDPELLFQRLITVCSDDDRNDALKYELAQYPISLFNDAGFMRDSKKNELSNHMLNNTPFMMSFLTLAVKVGQRLSMVVCYFTNCHGSLTTPFRQYWTRT